MITREPVEVGAISIYSQYPNISNNDEKECNFYIVSSISYNPSNNYKSL